MQLGEISVSFPCSRKSQTQIKVTVVRHDFRNPSYGQANALYQEAASGSTS
jgi:hypothetical protein